MSDPDAPPLDSESLVSLLDRHGVAYVLVGGLAAVAHGATRATFDIDIVPRRETHNLDMLAGALCAPRMPVFEYRLQKVAVDTATWSFKYTMRDRFTRKSRHGRDHISRATRQEVYKRDGFTCQFCQRPFSRADLTIDHLVPLARGGLDEVTNYVTCCRPCNHKLARSAPGGRGRIAEPPERPIDRQVGFTVVDQHVLVGE